MTDVGYALATLLAVMCVTRSIVQEEIFRPLRLAMITGFTIKLPRNKELHWDGGGDKGKLAYLVHCIYCTGFWVSIALGIPIIYATHPHTHPVTAAILTLALAEAAPRCLSLINKWTGDH